VHKCLYNTIVKKLWWVHAFNFVVTFFDQLGINKETGGIKNKTPLSPCRHGTLDGQTLSFYHRLLSGGSFV